MRKALLVLVLAVLLVGALPAQAAETVEVQAFTTGIVETAPWGTPLPLTVGKFFLIGEITTSPYGAEVIFDTRAGRRCGGAWGLPPGFEQDCKIVNPHPIREERVIHLAFMPTDDPDVWRLGDSTLSKVKGQFRLVLVEDSYIFTFTVEPYNPDAVVFLYRQPGLRR